MEKENKEITENIEQKKDNMKKKEQADKKKMYVIPGLILLLFLVLLFLWVTGINNKDNYIQIEDITEIEEVNFDNLLLSYRMYIYDNKSEIQECRYLCIFNTGSIYCFDYPENLWVDRYYDETNWESAENVIYLGQLSAEETESINQYVENYDIDERYINGNPTSMPLEGPLDQEEEESKEGQFTGGCLVRIYWHGEPETVRNIASYGIDYLGFNRYSTNLNLWTSEENAIAALELIESSGFYDRWVAMCLNNG